MLNEIQTRLVLDTLCVKYGFCISPEKQDSLVVDPPDSVPAFTHAVISAEGLDPQLLDRQLYRQVRECVEEAFHNASSQGETSRAEGGDA